MRNSYKIFLGIVIAGFLFVWFFSDSVRAVNCDITAMVFNPNGTQADTWFNRSNPPTFTVTLTSNGNCDSQTIPVSLIQRTTFTGNRTIWQQNIAFGQSNTVQLTFKAGERTCTPSVGADCAIAFQVTTGAGTFDSRSVSGSSGGLLYNCDKRFTLCDQSLDFIFLGIQGSGGGGAVCGNGTCETGETNANCPADCPPGSTGGGGGGVGYNFEISNPIGITTFQELVNIIGTWIFNLAIPIAVIIIIWAGILMLTSGGAPKRFEMGKKALTYAVIGLAIVLIGKGFVSLIKSILSLKNP